jgi:mono/diheme cytochrome c family protein
VRDRKWHAVALALTVLGVSVAALPFSSPTPRGTHWAQAHRRRIGPSSGDQACLSCHGAGGQGDRGPADERCLREGKRRWRPLSRDPRRRAGCADAPHRGLTDEQTWQLVSYASRSLSASMNVADPTSTRPAGEVRNGEALFFGRAACATCHQVNGRGGVVGPDLSLAGRLDPATVRRKILDPASPTSLAGRGAGPGPHGPR